MNQFDKVCLTCALLFCDEASLRCGRRRARAEYKAQWRARQRDRKAQIRRYQSERPPEAQARASEAMAIYMEAIQGARRGAK